MSRAGIPTDPDQLALDFAPEPAVPADPRVLEELARRLREADASLGQAEPPEVRIRLRHNRSTLGSLRLAPGPGSCWRLTLDAGLLRRDPRAALDLALLLLHRARRKRPPGRLLEVLARLRASRDAQPGPRRVRGLIHDARLEERLRQVAFRAWPGWDPARLPAVCWKASASRRVLGRYDRQAHRVEIHAALAHPAVPAVVLDNLLHHELLHAWLDPVRQGGRLVHHHAEFRRLERAFPGYALALDWERKTWPRLLRAQLATLRRAAATEDPQPPAGF